MKTARAFRQERMATTKQKRPTVTIRKRSTIGIKNRRSKASGNQRRKPNKRKESTIIFPVRNMIKSPTSRKTPTPPPKKARSTNLKVPTTARKKQKQQKPKVDQHPLPSHREKRLLVEKATIDSNEFYKDNNENSDTFPPPLVRMNDRPGAFRMHTDTNRSGHSDELTVATLPTQTKTKTQAEAETATVSTITASAVTSEDYKAEIQAEVQRQIGKGDVERATVIQVGEPLEIDHDRTATATASKKKNESTFCWALAAVSGSCWSLRRSLPW